MIYNKNYYIAPPCIFEVLPISVEDIEPFNLNQILIGKLSPHMVPYVKVKIYGIEFEALLDTGAYRSHIAPATAKALNLEVNETSMGRYPVVGNVETNVYNANYLIDGISNLFYDEFYELPYDFQYVIVLGSKFIGRCKELKITPESKSFELIL